MHAPTPLIATCMIPSHARMHVRPHRSTLNRPGRAHPTRLWSPVNLYRSVRFQIMFSNRQLNQLPGRLRGFTGGQNVYGCMVWSPFCMKIPCLETRTTTHLYACMACMDASPRDMHMRVRMCGRMCAYMHAREGLSLGT